MNKVVWSSSSGEWGTPPGLFERLNAKYSFSLDAACSESNHLCPYGYTVAGGFLCEDVATHRHYATTTEDGLSGSWQGHRVFLNPPYGRAIESWLRKAAEESQGSALVVALLPVRTGTRWWRECVVPYADIEYLPGRLKFVGADNSAPFDSAIARYR